MPGAARGAETDPHARRLRVLFDNLPALIAYWDRDLRNVIANQAYIEWFGVDPERMRGTHIREVLGEAVYAKNLPYLAAALAGEEQLFERTLVDTLGRTRHTQASYVPDIIDGAVLGFFVLVTDVTAQVEARRALAEAQRLAQVGSWTWETGSGTVAWSLEMYRITGLAADATPSIEAYLALVHPDDRDRLHAAAQQAVTAGTPYEIEYRLIRPDGEERDMQGRAEADRDPDGTVLRIRGTAQDVTTARRAARELARIHDELTAAHQLQSDLIVMIGHDVRQPITIILSLLDEVLDGWPDTPDDSKRACINRAIRTVCGMNELVNDVLTMASLDSGDIAHRPVPTDVVDIITDVTADVPIELHTDGHPTAVVDPWHLRQIITNLIGNAVKYGQPPITVITTQTSDAVAISIADHGEGVPDDFIPHLFDRFTRATTGIATSKPGTGFGLYIVRLLAETNHGHLTYAHNQPTGARFTVTLPAHQGAAGRFVLHSTQPQP